MPETELCISRSFIQYGPEADVNDSARLLSMCVFFFCLCRPTFRSYRPLDEDLKKSSLPAAEPEEVDQLVTKELGHAGEPAVVEEIASQPSIDK